MPVVVTNPVLSSVCLQGTIEVLTGKSHCDKMSQLGKNQKTAEVYLDPKEEQRRFLPSSKISNRCSSFGLPNSNELTEDAAIDCLARILVEIFLEQEHGHRK